MPALLNGTVRPGDYNYFRWTARAGENLTFDILAPPNGSKLGAEIDLLDEAGRLLEYSDDYERR